MRRQGSFVRAVATMGGVAGVVGGFALALWSSTLYDLVVGGKPPTALVPYVVVGYELTILVACISTFIATGHGAKFLPVPPPPEFMARYSSDTFGLHVYCTKTQVDEARRLLEESEAEEIHEF
jgi:molybdopterin-containing oxidoreductase family membrane subunit